MSKLLLSCIACLLACQFVAAQSTDPRKSIAATRIEQAPVIDGKLDEAIWENVPLATDFIQERPKAGKPSTLKSEVRIVYDDEALYIAGMFYDNPENISKTLTERDDLGNADAFLVGIDSYKSGINGNAFLMTAAGVQGDLSLGADGDNMNWDAVWEGRVQILDNGWSVEYKIPYSALRFANTPVQSWYINFGRLSNHKGEQSWWSEVNPNVNGFFTQAGILTDLKDLKPPVRLFAYPYVSAAVSRSPQGDVSTAYSGGMDIKYGINDAFTLDMTLIPDFGQVQSDNHVLNLGPFEVKYDENRQFFTEGTELFNKGNLFYSRRVGQSFGHAADLAIHQDEDYTFAPSEAPMINATKVSGRTNKGMGIGFFNAMTNETYATVENIETGEEREILFDPFTNFNVVVLDQNLKNNSNVSFTNTNVSRWGEALDANVTAAQFSLNNSSNTYNVSASGAFSQRYDQRQEGESFYENGYSYNIRAGKTSGKWQFNLRRSVESDTYNPNDMGFLYNANELSHGLWLGYINPEPKTSFFNNINADFNLNYSQLYEPRAYSSFNGFIGTYGQFSNFWNFSVGMGFNPVDRFDYFQARVPGQKFAIPESFNVNLWFSSDERKAFSTSAYAGTFRRPEWGQIDYWAGINPRYVVSEKLNLRHSFSYSIEQDDKGFVDHMHNEQGDVEHIVFGIRDVQTFENTFSGSYTFTNRMGLTLRLRHYWSKVPYTDEYFYLNKEGELDPAEDIVYLNKEGQHKYNTSFNAFNIDMVYRWRFAPGSELSLVWKSAFSDADDDVSRNFFSNMSSKVFSPSADFEKAAIPLHHFNNMLSLKVMYFLDYNQVRKHF